MNANQQPVGGYSRVEYGGSYTSTPTEFFFKRALMQNGQLTVTDYIQGGTDQISVDGNNTIQNFPYALAVGASQDNVSTSGNAGSTSYTVTRLE